MSFYLRTVKLYIFIIAINKSFEKYRSVIIRYAEKV